LRRANSELEHCINALAHDLRSPLVALLGFSRLLRQDYEAQLDETGRHFLDRIEQSGRTMESLIHDLLELSRIGQPGDRPSLVNPRAVLLQLQAELKSRLEAACIQLQLPETPPPPVYCDRTRLYQVLSNLIGNAIEHMGDGEENRIAVEITESENGHDIAVSDNGCGIAPEHQERIFEVFQSIGRKDGRRGSGIGLAIVKKIVETHGGRVWVESTRGEGSTFHVHLPRH
jgi:signal transduction histidine kinase